MQHTTYIGGSMAESARGVDVERAQIIIGKRPVGNYIQSSRVVKELAHSITVYTALMLRYGASLPTVEYGTSNVGGIKYLTYIMRFNMDSDLMAHFNQTSGNFTP